MINPVVDYNRAGQPLEDRKVLLTEDDCNIRRALCASLAAAGYFVHSYSKAEDALWAFVSDPTFSLLVTDFVLSGNLNGKSLAIKLRSLKPGIPVIFISGYPPAALVHCHGLSTSEICLMKPIAKDTLLKSVRDALATVASDNVQII